MDRATSGIYDPLLERDLTALPGAFETYLETHSEEELWVTLARFAVLAFAPSLHGSRAVQAFHAAWVLRQVTPLWRPLLLACATYAAVSRPAWSEPHILERIDAEAKPGVRILEEAVAAGDRAAAGRWLAARVDDALPDLRLIARGEGVLMLDTAIALEPLLGAPGRHALLHAVVLSLFADATEPDAPLERLVMDAVNARGSVEPVRDVLLWCARNARPSGTSGTSGTSGSSGEKVLHAGESDDGVRELEPVEPYPLGRDFAQTLLLHAAVRRFPAHVDPAPLLAVVRQNLQHGDDFSGWGG